MKIPWHVKLRKIFRTYFYLIMAIFLKSKETKSSLDKNSIKTIVIIRPNYRIGNLIFLTPLINEIHRHMPDVKIDLIVGMKIAGDILKPMPNIDNVIDIPRELLVHPIQMYNFVQNVRKKHYDLAINIVAGSISSQIVTILTNAKYKASTTSDRNITNLTHAIDYEGKYRHIGQQSLEFLKLFNIELPTENITLDIKLSKEELKEGQEQLNNILKEHHLNKNSKTVALFRNARFDKKISDEWWQEWHKALVQKDQKIVVIDILSPDILKKLNDECLEYSNKNLRILSAFFKACDMYVSADTGPMHLAAAAGANVMALFNKTEIQTYGTLGQTNYTLDINQMSPQEVAIQTYAYLEKTKGFTE